MQDFTKYIEDNTIRLEVSHRGGGIEIDATKFLGEKYLLRMTAYQNYLGGGLLGSIENSIQGRLREYPKSIQKKALELADALKKYYYEQTNLYAKKRDEWASTKNFEEQQSRPVSAY